MKITIKTILIMLILCSFLVSAITYTGPKWARIAGDTFRGDLGVLTNFNVNDKINMSGSVGGINMSDKLIVSDRLTIDAPINDPTLVFGEAGEDRFEFFYHTVLNYFEGYNFGRGMPFIRIHDSGGIALLNDQINMSYSGDINMSGALRANDYYSGDGSQGFTGTCTSGQDLDFRDGLLISCPP